MNRDAVYYICLFVCLFGDELSNSGGFYPDCRRKKPFLKCNTPSVNTLYNNVLVMARDFNNYKMSIRMTI